MNASIQQTPLLTAESYLSLRHRGRFDRHQNYQCAPLRSSPNSIVAPGTGEYRLTSRTKNPKTGKRRNLETFPSCSASEKHECGV
jgi:hypothetical protein